MPLTLPYAFNFIPPTPWLRWEAFSEVLSLLRSSFRAPKPLWPYAIAATTIRCDVAASYTFGVDAGVI